MTFSKLTKKKVLKGLQSVMKKNLSIFLHIVTIRKIFPSVAQCKSIIFQSKIRYIYLEASSSKINQSLLFHDLFLQNCSSFNIQRSNINASHCSTQQENLNNICIVIAVFVYFRSSYKREKNIAFTNPVKFASSQEAELVKSIGKGCNSLVTFNLRIQLVALNK